MQGTVSPSQSYNLASGYRNDAEFRHGATHKFWISAKDDGCAHAEPLRKIGNPK
jgi:hypothetical protein